MKKGLVVLIVLFTTASLCFGDQTFPSPNYKPAPDPIASPDAEIGGELSIFGGQYSKSFNYYLDNNSLTSEIFGVMFETLLGMNPVTLEYEPGLADRWSISDDKKSFTFHISNKARWSDGTPITAEDVLWTYEAILNPKNMTGPHKVSLERFLPPVILDKNTIRFTAKTIHWENLGACGGFHILPKHAYGALDFNKINFEFPVVSGLYRLGEIKEGIYVTLKRRSDWWNKDAPGARGIGNFNTLKFRFYADRINAFEAFKKGLIDLFPVYTSRIWVNETSGDLFNSNRIVKQKVINYQPVGFQGFAMNTRNFPFDDIRVRKAMACLLDRQKMNHTLMYDQYFLHRSYYEDLYTKKNPCPNPLQELDKKKARQLLTEAGWTVNPKTGFLEKNGKKFSFKFLTRDPSTDKFLAIYSEDLKDAGIELITDKKDGASWAKDMDEFNYQMTWAAWGAGIFKDPESMWSSKEADRTGSNNITGFKNNEVDALIEQQKGIFDIHQRNDIIRKIDRILCEDMPYVLLWNINYTRLLYWNKFGTPPTVLSKYGRENSAYSYWWLDLDSQADLAQAMESGTSLPPKRPAIDFDEVFTP
ncbi:MAG: extracellular solute-binding protein [Proteobacteria bacterium]|nr:extracellular solute-binding protein [Pseudomonadota bacterium]